ncbi:auxilin-like protein 1 isoform X2 [Manihot esculenta]|uniref:Uncharacterized protein n=1 Tax=Manihot esculenta TaxID=3983 RepID=A0ACB7HQS6_MANES|nr:auxilin-like protein 1 isoform X2 [Manihot esculenta]KAG8654645.1 hypothetical protein MANES_05G157300v8 [Manihot esculenta]
MEHHQAFSATAFSSKLANGGGLAGKHVYDGAFGGLVKPGSRIEDYRDIFGGSGACSIPILDFPELDRKTSVDARNPTTPEYSKIFCGFAEMEFAVSYEELFSKSKKVKNSSQEARVAARARFCPAGPKFYNVSEQQQVPSPEVAFQQLDGGKQFNMSYDKSNLESKTVTNGKTNDAHFHTVPGYNCSIDEITLSQMTEADKPVHTVLNDAHLNFIVAEGIKQSKPLRKVLSGPQPRDSAKNNSRDHANFQTKSIRHRSFSNDVSFDAFEIGLGTHPSTVATPLGSLPNRYGMRSMNSKFGDFSNDVSEGAAGSYSPPLFDEEIDANSAAAASVAAVKKAIEAAQMKIKIAKELMERKQGFQNHVRPRFRDGLKGEKREVKAAEKANRSIEEEAREMLQKVYTPKQVFTSLVEHSSTKVSQVTSEFRNVKKSSPTRNAVGKTNSTGSKLAQVDNSVEAESRKATEPADTSDHRAITSEVDQANNAKKMIPTANENKCREKMTGEENIEKSVEYDDEKPKSFEEAPKQEKVERELNSEEAAFEWDVYGNNSKPAEVLYHHIENEEKIRVSYKQKEAGQVPNHCEQEECETIAKRLHEREENTELEMKELKEAQNWVNIEKKQRDAHNCEKMEERSSEIPAVHEYERRLDETHSHEENGKGEKEYLEGIASEKEQQEGSYLENEKKLSDAKPEDAGKFVQVHEQEAIKVKFNVFWDKEESQEVLREDCGTKGNENLEEAKQKEEMLKEDYHINETESERTCRVLETERIQTQIHPVAEDERFQENNLEATNDVDELEKNENAGNADEAHGDKRRFKHVEVTADVPAFEENGKMREVSEDSFPKESGKESEAVEEANDLVEDEKFGTDVPEQGLARLDGIDKQAADLYLGETDVNLDCKLNDFHVEYKSICEQEKHNEEVTFQLDKNDKDDSESEVCPSDEENESNFLPSHEGGWSGNGIESKTLCDSVKHVEEEDCELGENNQDVKNSEVPTNHDEEIYFESSSEKEEMNNRFDMQAGQQPHIFEEGKTKMGISQEERINQNIDKKDKYDESPTEEKREAEDYLKKEVLLEKDHGRKEEEKMREMEKEKEKERKAVERAIREARERAFAEARERAERIAAARASAAAHQKAMADAQERLEKACTEAIAKSAAEKASMEAKLKAERAAVERATAEARERALEKALSEKAKARNHAEKFSGPSRDAGIKSDDQQYKEKFSGANGESAERCKATLARNQRTAERAAKALAEKNMRDLFAQKEQAERNRLAETLDADVKRWSSGKEKNLRALLSTLQYILGPDSGWQPISLTDLISTAAVKKAYRKATLYVHPDKLQQRGASIQQKYTCEKVFDLLKDAWNKFSAEER